MGGGGGGGGSAVDQIHVLAVILSERLLKNKKQKSKCTKNCSKLREYVWCVSVHVCVCACVRDGEGT